jgi:hypothetical protein
VSGIAGVEIGADTVRVVVRSRNGSVQTGERPFDRERIDDIVDELSTTMGDVRGIGLAVGLAHLHVKHVTLPPAPHASQRQMIVVEPERWFAAAQRGQTAVALTANGEVALAADGALVEECVRAFATWGPVRRIDAAPLALARALSKAGTPTVRASLSAGAHEIGMVDLADGQVRSVRRARAGDFELPAPTPPVTGLDPSFSAAWGASLDFDGDVHEMLLTPALERQFLGERRRRIGVWCMAAAAALTAAVWSAGVARDRALDATNEAVSLARTKAQRGTALASSALNIDRELAAVALTTTSRPDVPRAFAALGSRLPIDAVAQRVRMTGTEWQVEGNARTASAVLSALAVESSFANVRFLAPSTRFRDGTAERETFSIAFSVR